MLCLLAAGLDIAAEFLVLISHILSQEAMVHYCTFICTFYVIFLKNKSCDGPEFSVEESYLKYIGTAI